MQQKISRVLMSGVVLGWLIAVPAIAQQDKPATPAAPKTDAPAKPDAAAKPSAPAKAEAHQGAEDAPLAGEASGSPQDQEKAERARRARMASTVTAVQLKVGDKAISLNTGVETTKGPDYESLAKVKTGEILQLTRSQAIKLKSAISLKFGDLTLKTENVAKNYPGVYSIWLKKTDKGWNFVFNQKPDVWGTQHDPKADVGEVPVDYSPLSPETEKLAFALTQEGEGGTLKITWGAHQWSAKFTFAK